MTRSTHKEDTMNATRECIECRKGEHETDGPVRMFHVTNPDTGGKIVLRGYLCAEHEHCFIDDGYTVKGV